MKEVAIVAAVRSPFGKIGGMLAGLDPFQLTTPVLNEVVRRAGIKHEEINEVLFSSCITIQAVSGRPYALEAGFPLSVPGMAISRGCGSTVTSAAIATSMIKSGMGDTYLVAGQESNSRGAFMMERPTKANPMQPPKWTCDYISPPCYDNEPMGLTAERVAEIYGITREECDEFACWSQEKAAKAWKSGFYEDQVLPYDVVINKQKVTVKQDETLRPTTMEALGRLRPAFKAGGVCTAGNSSPVGDGVSALILMDKEKAEAQGLDILATFKDYVVIGRDPRTMGLGPVDATKKILDKNHLTFRDIDMIELNEAFAAQTLGCLRELDFPREKLNIYGGALALGHPTAATGGILMTKACYAFKQTGAERALITFCIGGGMGVACLLENH